MAAPPGLYTYLARFFARIVALWHVQVCETHVVQLQEQKTLGRALCDIEDKIMQRRRQDVQTTPGPVKSSLAQLCVSELYRAHQNVTLPLGPHLSHPRTAPHTVCSPPQFELRPAAPRQPSARRPKRTFPLLSNRPQYPSTHFRSACTSPLTPAFQLVVVLTACPRQVRESGTLCMHLPACRAWKCGA
jgi:hypothetical protein